MVVLQIVSQHGSVSKDSIHVNLGNDKSSRTDVLRHQGHANAVIVPVLTIQLAREAPKGSQESSDNHVGCIQNQ